MFMSSDSLCFGQHNVPSALSRFLFQHVQAEFLPVYQQQLKDVIIGQVDREGPTRDMPLTGLKVVVNAGNGMGGFLAETLSEVGENIWCFGFSNCEKTHWIMRQPLSHVASIKL